MKSIIVLPTYNEAENLERLVREIRMAKPDLDILIIDDGSPDGTGRLANMLTGEYDGVRVIHRPAKSGRGSAIVAGFKYAINGGYDYVLEIDVDFSHSPAEIPALIDAAGDADLVIASRFVAGGHVEGWRWSRKVIHFMADMSVKIILGTPNTDHTNGFRCYRVEKLKNINFERLSGFGYIGQTLLENLFHKLGYKIREVPAVFKNRKMGKSKMGRKEMINGLKAMLKLRRNYSRHGINYYLSL